MKFVDKRVESIILLSGKERYSHFIKVVADMEDVWALYDDGWALAETDSGEKVFPVWPNKEFAEICARGEWGNYMPECIPLEDFMYELIPVLKDSKILLGIFPTPEEKGTTPSYDMLISHLEEELSNY